MKSIVSCLIFIKFLFDIVFTLDNSNYDETFEINTHTVQVQNKTFYNRLLKNWNCCQSKNDQQETQSKMR